MRTVSSFVLVPSVLLVGSLLAGCGGVDEQKSDAAGRSEQIKAPSQVAGQGSGAASKQEVKLPTATGRSVVYTASLKVRAKNVREAAGQAKQLVTAAGGYVGSEDASTSPEAPPAATVTFKIPADKYPGVLDQLSTRLGTRLSLQQQAEDVTQEVADVESRVRSANAALASFRKLLDRANTVGEVLNVEREMTQREADLEALQARQKSLSQQTQFATVTLQLESVPAQTASPEGGFFGGLKAGWKAFTAFAVGAAAVLGWLVPFLLTAVILSIPGWQVVRHLRRRRTTAQQKSA